MRRKVLDGPPWGRYVDPDEEYVKGQLGSLGSGLVGGWAYATTGGFFTDEDPAVEAEIKREAERIQASRARPPAPERVPDSGEPSEAPATRSAA
jgi:hypothetical protein